MNDRLQGIATFVQVAEAGSFALAAQRLKLTRSAVGKTIGRLEARLGTRLFQRTTRRQSLTEDGQAFYEHCLRALGELEAAEAVLDAGTREPSGRLRVSAPVLFGRHCVAPVLLALARRYPKLELEMCFSDRVVDLVEDGFDLAVRVGPLADSATLVGRRLGTQRMAFCGSPAYLDAHGVPSRLHELASHTVVVYHKPGNDVPWRLRDIDGTVDDVQLPNRIRFDDLQAIADAGVAGAGLVWLPCWLAAPHIRAGELTLVCDIERLLSTDIHAVWPQTRFMRPKLRVAIDALVAEIPGMVGH